jgi:hypothetical protein
MGKPWEVVAEEQLYLRLGMSEDNAFQDTEYLSALVKPFGK